MKISLPRAGKDHSKIAQIMDSLLDEVKYRGTIDIYRCALSICERQFGPNSSKTLDVLGDMSMVRMAYTFENNKEERFYEDFVARAGRDHPKAAQVLDAYFHAAKSYLLFESNYNETERVYRKIVLPFYERKFGPNSSETLDALSNMFVAHMKRQRYKNGKEVYEDFVARAGRDHPEIAQVLNSMLREVINKVEFMRQDDIRGVEYFIPICKRLFGPNDFKIVEIIKEIDDNFERNWRYEKFEKRQEELTIEKARSHGWDGTRSYLGSEYTNAVNFLRENCKCSDYQGYGETDDCGDADGEGE